MISPVSLISRHLRGELVRVGGATGQAGSSSSSGLAAANELGTGVQLNGDGLDPAHGLVAAERVVSQLAGPGSGCSSCLCNLKLHRVKFKLKA